MVELISTLGLQHVSANNIINGQSLLSKLSEQLTTGIYSSNLSDYSSSSAQKLLNFTSNISEQKGFLSVIGTISPRISAYDSSLTGIEDTVSDATSTLLSSTTYDSGTVSSLQSSLEGYIDDIAYYMNQKISDRYIFSGTRYDQAPMITGDSLKTLLHTAPTSTATVASPAVPEYDTDYTPTAAAVAATATATGGMDFAAATPGANGNNISITITTDGGAPATYGATVTDSTTTPATTETYTGLDAATFWTDLQTALGASTLVTGTVSGGTADVTTMVGNSYALSGGSDATSALTPHADAWVKDSVRIDTTKTLNYGVTSNDTGFQQVILGLRYAYAATQDPDNYASLMSTAQSLLSTGLNNIRGTHTAVTNANSTLTKTKETITTNVTNLQDQVSNIESVDVNEVGVKITVLQAQLEASYSVTATMAKLSIVNYL